MGKRTLVASGESACTIGSNGSVVTFPSSGNVWNDRSVTGVHDVKILASLSASSNYKVRLVGSYQDPSSGSVFNGLLHEFSPGDTDGDGAGKEVFRSAGTQIHFEQIEIENSCAASTLDVGQLGAIWKSHDS